MLKKSYAKAEEIPAGFESLYTEQGGVFVLTGVEGGGADDGSVKRLETTLAKVRNELKAANAKVAAFGDLDAEAARVAIAERDDLKVQLETAGGKPDDNKIAELVKQRVALVTGPLDKKINDLTSQLTVATTEATSLKEARKRDKINQNIFETAMKSGMSKEAAQAAIALVGHQFDLSDDGKPVTRDMEGIVPGLDVGQVVNDMKGSHPFLWPTSTGGGAQGGNGGVGGKNPYTEKNWNVTEQGRLMATDMKKAEAMASAAGVSVNAIAPKKG